MGTGINDSVIEALRQELQDTLDYPDSELAEIIRDVGFSCTCCGRCCTREFNGHVFLLDEDTMQVKQIDPDALVPAPDYELCDQNGRFYVSGYALRVKKDGSCIFLDEGRCVIYDRRFSICRLYPYMLHREADENGRIDWRQISGLDLHGIYHTDIPEEEAIRLARETKAYETAYLDQMIRFYKAASAYFSDHHLKHVRRTYDLQMRRFCKGSEIEVMVYHNGAFELNRVSSGDY